MPVQKCSRAGRPGWKWGQSGKCYVGPGAKAKAAKQGVAVRASGRAENALAGRVDPLRSDPTRTKMLRDQFVRDLKKRMLELKRRIVNLIVYEDAFGLKMPYNSQGVTVNHRFAFETNAKKVEAYNEWLREQYQGLVTSQEDAYWERYIAEGYEKGAGRAFSDVYKQRRAESYGSEEKMAHYAGTREQFLQSSFGAAESLEKVKLLAGRTLTDLKGVGEATAAQMSRVLTDGLVQGQNPWTIAREMTKTVDKISKNRAIVIARTEIIRAHAEGQLDALERLGVEEIGVQVEWSSAGDDRVCDQCQPLEGQIFKIEESHGVIPLHPQCRCAWIPYTDSIGKATTVAKPKKEAEQEPTKVQEPTPALTKGEKIATNYYTSLPAGQSTSRMQGLLGGQLDPTTPQETEFVKSFFSAASKLPTEETIGYRGLATESLEQFQAGKLIKGVPVESWTASPDVAEGYSIVTKGVDPSKKNTVILQLEDKFKNPASVIRNPEGKELWRLKSEGYIVDSVKEVNGKVFVKVHTASQEEVLAGKVADLEERIAKAKQYGFSNAQKELEKELSQITPTKAPTPKAAPTVKPSVKVPPRDVVRLTIKTTKVVKPPEPQKIPNETFVDRSILSGPKSSEVKSIISDLQDRHPRLDEHLKSRGINVTTQNRTTLKGTDGTAGLYHPESKFIEVALKTPEKPLKLGKFNVSPGGPSNLRHEIGHRLHDNLKGREYLGKPESFWSFKRALRDAADPSNSKYNKWTPAYDKFFSKRVSQYATENFEECFAECFTAYTHPEYSGQLPPTVHSYFKNLLAGE